MAKHYCIHPKAFASDRLDIDLWGVVGESWFEDGFTAADFKAEIDAMAEGVTQIHLHINSPGGLVTEGNAIYNIILARPEETYAHIDFAASMASIIAMAADHVDMAENGFFMIHRPWSLLVGDAPELRKQADLLDKMENAAVQAYLRYYAGTEEELRAAIAAETWYSADEALEAGFIQEITHQSAKLTAAAIRPSLSHFHELPAELHFIELFYEQPQPESATTATGLEIQTQDDLADDVPQPVDLAPAPQSDTPAAPADGPVADAVLELTDAAYDEGYLEGYAAGKDAAGAEFSEIVQSVKADYVQACAMRDAAVADAAAAKAKIDAQRAEHANQIATLNHQHQQQVQNMTQQLHSLDAGFADPNADAGPAVTITDDMSLSEAIDAVKANLNLAEEDAQVWLLEHHQAFYVRHTGIRLSDKEQK